MTTKETTTHTAGPWVASEIGPENGSWLKWAISAHGPIAYGGDNGDGQENSRSNARLIAAAPDLRTSLGALLRTCQDAARHGWNQTERDAIHWACVDAQAAIAKAEGGA